ncbi:uncharacterized protein LOC117562785 [Gymnodraco acuticeps]|uniref:Uncharacterized protein LOC117562785 n=1 Tax=Gymnodraco acuticeps TaxID=8218 RepID=A0A6P8WGK1_GYMAC|nr:uncharacterized protein LOC117562785 [Gymnodraco acuticeps]
MERETVCLTEFAGTGDLGNMSKVQMLLSLKKQRLTAEEIFALFEKTIAEYEEELSRLKEENKRLQKLLDAVLQPQLRIHRAALRKKKMATSSTPNCTTLTVWIIGDSYVRRGAQRATETIGSNLGLDLRVCWFSWGGLRWRGVLPFFSYSLRGIAVPDVLLIHCDLGDVPSVQLLNQMKEDLHQLHHRHPGMKIMLSQINQRRRWRAGANAVKIDKARKFVNSVMATFVHSLNGVIVDHSNIRHDSPGLFLRDRVHFTPRGNDIFLKSLANCLKDHLQRL